MFNKSAIVTVWTFEVLMWIPKKWNGPMEGSSLGEIVYLTSLIRLPCFPSYDIKITKTSGSHARTWVGYLQKWQTDSFWFTSTFRSIFSAKTASIFKIVDKPHRCIIPIRSTITPKWSMHWAIFIFSLH